MPLNENQTPWIWAMHHRYTANCYVQLQKRFTLDKHVESITLQCHCFGDYKLFLNGHYIGRKCAPDSEHILYYEEYVLAGTNSELVRTDNQFNVFAHNDGIGTHNHPASGAGFWLHATVYYIDGHQEIIQTDNTWKARIPIWWNQAARQLFWTTGFQEEVDLPSYERLERVCKENEDATSPASKQGAAWESAQAVLLPSESVGTLTKLPIPCLTETFMDTGQLLEMGRTQMRLPTDTFISPAEMMYHAITYPQQKHMGTISDLTMRLDGEAAPYLVIDFGCEVVGFPSVSFFSSGEGILLLGYSECLDESGRVDPTRQGIHQLDTLHFGAGTHHWEMFNRRAFRYLQITVLGSAQTLQWKQIGINKAGYPVRDAAGDFRCSDPALNDIYQVSKRTLSLCMSGVIEDCPLRERAQYIGDLYVDAIMAYYAFGEYELPKKALLQFAQEQHTDGWIPSIVPGSTDHNIIDYLPLFVSAVWEYYRYSGDFDTVRRIYPNLKSLMAYLSQYENADGLLENQRNWWVFIDWSTVEKEGIVTALQCLYYRAQQEYASLSELCGEPEHAEAYRRKARRLKDVINEKLYDTKIGAFFDCLNGTVRGNCSQQTNCFAALCGVADGTHFKQCGHFIQQNVGKGIFTAYFKNYEQQALHLFGLKDEFRSGFSYWQEQLNCGATTWWETFIPGTKDIPNASLCHAWGAGPLNLLPQYFSGISPTRPDFREVLIQPEFYDLEWMEAKVPTPHGTLMFRGDKKRDRTEMTVQLPAGIRAKLVLPQSSRGYQITYQSGLVVTQKNSTEFVLDASAAAGKLMLQTALSELS